jgi:hypothetical protein
MNYRAKSVRTDTLFIRLRRISWSQWLRGLGHEVLIKNNSIMGEQTTSV